MGEMFWVVVVIVVILYLTIQGLRLRAQNRRIEASQPIVDFELRGVEVLKQVGSPTWSSADYMAEKQQAIRAIDSLVIDGSRLSAPSIKYRMELDMFLGFLNSLRHEWEGYPYVTEGEKEDLAHRQRDTERHLDLWKAARGPIPPPAPKRRQKNWQALLFGPGPDN